MKQDKEIPKDSVKYYCQSCHTKLESNHAPCPSCGCKNVEVKATAATAIGLALKSSLKARHKQKGFKKFKKETVNGHFESGDPKYPNGVDKKRIIDKEKDDYLEIVTDERTGEVIRDVHEPLSKHI